METYILTAGIFVTLLFIIGVILYQLEKSKELDKREFQKKMRNEYRTNEEFISYP